MEKFDRLLEEQRKSISQTMEKIRKLESFELEYKQLKKRLNEASQSFSKSVIVPFSPKALVPARLIHTNEVLVYLGGCAEHFCEVSTCQAVSIISNRISRIQSEVKRLRDQRQLLLDREKYTAKLVKGGEPHTLDEESDEDRVMEIHEEYDEEKDKSWQEKHRKHLRSELAKERATREAIVLSPLPDDKDSEESASSSPYYPDIIVNHSRNPALPVNPDFRDWHSASPADVAAYIQKHHRKGILKPPKTTSQVENAEPPPVPLTAPMTIQSPFSQVVERSPSDSAGIVYNVSDHKPVSRFRANKMRGI